jgi:hypothetical protein
MRHHTSRENTSGVRQVGIADTRCTRETDLHTFSLRVGSRLDVTAEEGRAVERILGAKDVEFSR